MGIIGLIKRARGCELMCTKKYPDASQRRDIFFVESPLRIFGF